MDLEGNHQNLATSFPSHLVSTAVPTLDAPSGQAPVLLYENTSSTNPSNPNLSSSSTVCPPPSSPSSSIFSNAQHDIYRLPNVVNTRDNTTSLDNIAGKLPKSKHLFVFITMKFDDQFSSISNFIGSNIEAVQISFVK